MLILLVTIFGATDVFAQSGRLTKGEKGIIVMNIAVFVAAPILLTTIPPDIDIAKEPRLYISLGLVVSSATLSIIAGRKRNKKRGNKTRW